jgi:uncharacterized membrane protein YfcA
MNNSIPTIPFLPIPLMIWIFGWAVFFLIIWFLRSRANQRKLELIHKERLAAMEKGIPMPELPDYDRPATHSWIQYFVTFCEINPQWPLGFGAISIMLGIGVSLALRLSGEEYHQHVWSFGLIGIFLGLGLILHYYLTRNGRS